MPTKLYDYQQKIVDNCKSTKVPLFMGMGTGKTVTSLAIYNKYRTHKILVICLISKMEDWKRDLKLECNMDAVILNKGTKRNLKEIELSYSNAYIINFESVWRMGMALYKWVDINTTILIDESHKIKNPSSNIGKYCRKLGERTNHKILLTGTPQSQGYIDYYNQLNFLDIIPHTFADFKKMFCVYEDKMFNNFPVKTLVGYKNTKLLDKIIKENCIFFERSVDEELIPTDIVQHLSKPKCYDKFKRERVYKDVAADSISKLFVSMRTICSGFIGEYQVDKQKIQWLDDFLDCFEDRLVVFYNFNVERDSIIELLEKKKIPYSEYNGRTKSFETFKNEEKSVILCQFKTASTGINDLVISNTCVMYSPPTVYIDFVQSKKRIDRIGQTKKPLFYYLVTDNTVEEKIMDNLNKGLDFDDRMFDRYLKGE